ncbi:MAG: PBP1A family penicillin-binding protein [Proteobacteria bacterium]|nr:PBP1A family penicillin-binding protein [Pseudomonadota bacterium]
MWAVIVFSLAAAWYATDLPDVDKAFSATRRPTITVLADDGAPLVRTGDVYGRLIGLNDLPKALPQAVLATEDRRFYSHFGIDIIGLGRAMAANLRAGRIVQGGSTITQQVAKNLFLTPERTLKRKIQELMLALWLEQKFTKDQILTIYLNRVYLGTGTYGVDAAAKKYFGRPAERLTVYQAAMLAGLLKAPSRYNLIAHPARAKARTAQVLKNMVAAGYLSQANARQADIGTAPVKSATASPGSRYFIDWILAQVSDYINPGDRDLIVRTTFSSDIQRLAEAGVEKALSRNGVQSGSRAGIGQVALVALTPEGAVRAMVGGRSYGESQFNRVTQARRQPGSAFKPFVYLAGLESGLVPGDVMIDESVTIDGWRPSNFNRRYQGPVTVKAALARSINTVAVKIGEKAGRARVIETARRLGLSGNFKPTPSLALGVAEVTLLELTAAYGPFANGGAGVWAYGIEEIRDGGGSLLYRRGGSGPGRVISRRDVAAMNDMLAGAVTDGTGRNAGIGRPQAGKTGTSQNFRDAWFIGYTADLVAGVWMGNDNGAEMKNVTGGGAPAKLWRDFMAAAHAGLPAHALPGLDKIPDQPPEKESPGFWKSIFAKL